MKRSKSEVNINPLLHDLPETTQETICGGSTSGGVNTMFCDGSVRSVRSSLSSNSSGGTYYTGSITVSDD